MTNPMMALFLGVSTLATSAFAQDPQVPQAKYPAAIVFEGGKGDSWNDADRSKHTPLWRLYICLEQTSSPVVGQLALELNQLGTPVELTAATAKETLSIERLNKVLLNYEYSAQLVNDSVNSQINTRGFANVKIKSEQTWELVYLAPHQTHVHNPSQNIDLFNVRVDGDTFVQFGQYKYEVNGEMFYISRTLDRVVVSEADKISHVVAACEQANNPFVLQVGDEIGLDQ